MSPFDEVDRETACAAALAWLPGMSPARLAVVLDGRTADEAWERVRAGWVPHTFRPRDRQPEIAAAWRTAAASRPPDAAVEACAARGVHPVLPARLPSPDRLAGATPPVSVLFVAGDTDALDRPCVAVVGTRRATALGREVAAVVSGDLARAGVAVVSGLALGIDAAAHRGALGVLDGAPPVAVVGTGPDVTYPVANARLWSAVAARGVILSEHPPGTTAQAHHFPQRNRIVAALSSVVVVVESHRTGGALITADLAGAMGRTVGVVPGSLRNPAAEGSNQLLREGQVVPILDSLDVLVAAGLTARRAEGPAPGDPVEQLVLDHLGDGATVDQLAARVGLGLDDVLGALDRLDERGLVRPSGSDWQPVLRSKVW